MTIVKKIALFVLVFVITFGVGALLGGYFNNKPSIEEKVSGGKTASILFMGIDARDAKSNSRSDTMIVASIDSKAKKVVLVSIPRDTRIKDSRGRSDRINSVNYIKGPEAACEEVSKLLGTEIDHYVITNFAGFEKIVDTLGGVHIDVETDMPHADPVNPELAINLHRGYQYLDGKQALGYVRWRGGPTADIGRTQRQQKFIKALAQEMFKARTIVKLPKLIPEIEKNVRTNMSLNDMLCLAKMADDFNEPGSIISQTLPGYPHTDPATGASYWEADKEATNGIIEALMNGKKFNVVTDPPEWVKKERNFTPLPSEQVIEVNKQEEEQTQDENDASTGQNQTGNQGVPGEGSTDKPGDSGTPSGNSGQFPADNPPGNTTIDGSTHSNPVNPPVTPDSKPQPDGAKPGQVIIN